MSSTTSSISSGLDIIGIVDKLMDMQRIPLNRMEAVKSEKKNQLTNYTKLQNQIQNLQTNLNNLQIGVTAKSYETTSSNISVLNATAYGTQIDQGSHTIAVTQLATCNQINSDPLSSNNTALGISGNISIQMNNLQFNVAINSTDTLENLRDNINNNVQNSGISASILSSNDMLGNPEFHLVLTSNQSGSSNQITVTENFTAGNTLNITNQMVAGLDAQFTVDNYQVVRSTNSINDVLDGIILNLNSIGTTNINTTVISNVQNYQVLIQRSLDAYNNIIGFLNASQSESQLRDSTYPIIKMQLQNLMNGTFGSRCDLKTLAEIGIVSSPADKLLNSEGSQYTSNGKLQIDANQMAMAMNEDLGGFTAALNDPNNGFIEQLGNVITTMTQFNGNGGGAIFNTTQTINQQITYMDNRIFKEEERMDVIRENLIKQYASLDTLIQKSQQTTDFLTMQLATLNNYNKK
jgi:flagellar hook-associated protein 2